eukprot:403333466
MIGVLFQFAHSEQYCQGKYPLVFAHNYTLDPLATGDVYFNVIEHSTNLNQLIIGGRTNDYQLYLEGDSIFKPLIVQVQNYDDPQKVPSLNYALIYDKDNYEVSDIQIDEVGNNGYFSIQHYQKQGELFILIFQLEERLTNVAKLFKIQSIYNFFNYVGSMIIRYDQVHYFTNLYVQGFFYDNNQWKFVINEYTDMQSPDQQKYPTFTEYFYDTKVQNVVIEHSSVDTSLQYVVNVGYFMNLLKNESCPFIQLIPLSTLNMKIAIIEDPDIRLKISHIDNLNGNLFVAGIDDLQ